MNIENLLVQDTDNFDPSSAYKHSTLNMIEIGLRDYFAAAVLQGFMVNNKGRFAPEDDAAYCFKIADAMLEARNG